MTIAAGNSLREESAFGIRSGESIFDVLTRRKGITNGFDALRIVLSITILSIHVRVLAGVPGFGQLFTAAIEDRNPVNTLGAFSYTKPISLALVPAFFALSGFLVVASAFRLRSTLKFLMHRALRIVPALAAEIALSALIIGPIVTTLPLNQYFLDMQFYKYFLNIIGVVQFYLPGVFVTNSVTMVNGNLWTLPPEFYCYLFIASLMSTEVLYNRLYCTVAFLLGTVLLAFLHVRYNISALNPALYPPHVITYYFFVGVMFFHYKEIIPLRVMLFVLSGIVSYLCLRYNALTYLAPIPLTYCVVFLGLSHVNRLEFLRKLDFSYGIYLYNFPIIQLLLYFNPELSNHIGLLWICSLSSTFLFSVLSWIFIEKRALALKSKIR